MVEGIKSSRVRVRLFRPVKSNWVDGTITSRCHDALRVELDEGGYTWIWPESDIDRLHFHWINDDGTVKDESNG